MTTAPTEGTTAATMTEVLCPDLDDEFSDAVPDNGVFEGDVDGASLPDVAVV